MSDDFAALLAAQGALENLRVEPGDKLSVTVVHMGDENIFVSLSPTQEGFIPRADLLNDAGEVELSVGDQVDAFVLTTGESIELTVKLAKGRIDVDMLQAACRGGIPIDGTVTGTNKGGLQVNVGGGRGFCPASQVELGFVEDLAIYVGRTLPFKVMEVQEEGRNVLLSRRALLEAERAEQAAVLRKRLEVGLRLDGVVSRVTGFGAFVDLGGLDGLIPISELSHRRIGSVEEVVNVGDAVAVEILRIEPDPKRSGEQRIALSLRATQEDPFDRLASALRVNQTLTGSVTQVKEFGAFVRIEGGVEGLVHISELADRRVGHPSEIVRVGEDVEVRVLKVDLEQRRISLSLKPGMGAALTDGDNPQFRPGDLVTAVVERHEPFGVFVKFEGSATTALLPASETGTERGTDLRRALPLASSVELVISSVDDRGRLRVSKKARAEAEERATANEYQKEQQAGASLGRLGDLLKARFPQ